MKELLEIGLQIGGWSLVLLCIGSLAIPKALGWRDHLVALPPLMRELWWTYSIYILSSHAFFAVLLLAFDDWLMSGTGAAKAMNVFMLLWWGIRLWLQFFGFDFAAVTVQNRFNTIAKQILSALFIGLVVLLAGLLCWNLGMLKP